MLVSLIRTLLLYFLLILAIRLMGKRQIGELEPSEFVVAILIADLASVPMQDLGIPLLAGVIPILTVLAVEILLSVLSYYVIPIRKLLCGTPTVLIENGTILQKNMKRTRVTTDELMEQLREKGFLDPSQIQWAILETNGQINAFPSPALEPASKQDLGISAPARSLPVTLISNGKLLRQNLASSSYSAAGLHRFLTEQGLTVRDVFLLTCDANGHLTISRKQEPS